MVGILLWVRVPEGMCTLIPCLLLPLTAEVIVLSRFPFPCLPLPGPCSGTVSQNVSCKLFLVTATGHTHCPSLQCSAGFPSASSSLQPSIPLEGETGGSDSRGHLLLSEAEGNLGYVRVCFRHDKQNTILGPTLPALRLAGCW